MTLFERLHSIVSELAPEYVLVIRDEIGQAWAAISSQDFAKDAVPEIQKLLEQDTRRAEAEE